MKLLTVILPDRDTDIGKKEKIEELEGSLGTDLTDDKLMHSVLEGDKDSVDDAKIIEESISQGIGSFTPDIMMEKFVNNYKEAKELYGETLIKLLSSYNPDYIEKNIKIPEFQRELQKAIEDKIKELKQKKLIDSDGAVTKRGKKMAMLVLLVEEIDHLNPKGFTGEQPHKKRHPYGIKHEVHNYKKGDRYADLALKKSISRAIKRGHTELHKEDLRTFSRKARGHIEIIYGLDASGSMKGKKIEAAKKAGIALSFKAIHERNKVGLLVFETTVKESVPPTLDFPKLLEHITDIQATKQTDFSQMLGKSLDLFSSEDVTKHLVLLTDAMPTVGENPEKATLEAVSQAREMGISVSVIGIGLEKGSEMLAKKIAELGNGKFHVVNNLENLDAIILQDYYEYS